jgi:hypothetical protein
VGVGAGDEDVAGRNAAHSRHGVAQVCRNPCRDRRQIERDDRGAVSPVIEERHSPVERSVDARGGAPAYDPPQRDGEVRSDIDLCEAGAQLAQGRRPDTSRASVWNTASLSASD